MPAGKWPWWYQPRGAMAERRFSEDEVAAIFKQATETQDAPQRQVSAAAGLTLAQIQQIGLEAGIAPELVHRAAASLAVAGAPVARRFMGLPIGVGHTVELDYKLSDADWDRLVVDLRETFGAFGTVRQDGNFRQWRNGNLVVAVEPTPTGQRVLLQTVRATSRIWMAGSLATMGVGVFSAVATAITRPGGGGLAILLEMAALSAGMFAMGAMRLPGWASERREQMAALAARLALGPPSSSP